MSCEEHRCFRTNELRQYLEGWSDTRMIVQRLWICRECGLKVWVDLPKVVDRGAVPDNCVFVTPV